VYTDPRVVQLVEQFFVPVRIHVKDQAADFKRLGERFGSLWTPTILVVDTNGQERHRIEGFLPVDDLLPQLALGAAHGAFASGNFAAAERQFEEITKSYGTSDAAPEAQYWAGVSRYKASGEAQALKDTARRFSERYQESSWAKKASVWK
jgi:TolA-binding protein